VNTGTSGRRVTSAWEPSVPSRHQAGDRPELQREYLGRPLTFEPENKQVTADQLRHMLADARRDRAVVLRRPLPSKIMTVATPIFGRKGETLAALSLVVPDQTLDPRRLIPALQTASLAIARGMGTAEPARLTAS
jgi:DNA-binding IclR family transcriptional regulator